MSNDGRYQCVDCKFFSAPHGQCRKSPPVAVNYDHRASMEDAPYIMFRFQWPEVRPSDWCGAFSAKGAK